MGNEKKVEEECSSNKNIISERQEDEGGRTRRLSSLLGVSIYVKQNTERPSSARTRGRGQNKEEKTNTRRMKLKQQRAICVQGEQAIPTEEEEER